MFNRWTYFEDVAAANTDNPQRDGTLHDYWTNSPTKAWVDPNATSWVLSYVEGTGELVLFPQGGPGPVWISPSVNSLEVADAHLSGYERAQGSWDWLSKRLGNLPW